ncbi:sodium/bile acid cotransporter 4-like [Acipenser ruthenus]|uniref:sodium/bile acid cotransporter 4-like n=1 Tax=Acipenser ruthenus TaxID=7906 RepID=UPI00145AEA76|nr:sodium/bile acid cotransporter 4-like [Acipenser ruthenus]
MMENTNGIENGTRTPDNFTDFYNFTENAINTTTGGVSSTAHFPVSLSEFVTLAEMVVTREPASIEGTTLRTTAAGTWGAEVNSTIAGSANLVVAFWNSPLNHGINVFVGIVLCFTMLGLGCTVEVSQLGEHVRRPIGVLLALISQFVIMPLVAFLLALIFNLDEVAAIAVLLCGCCPGGNLSNILSLLVNGEMNLSIIMTISSTALALFLMPLCLWIYSRAWINTPIVDLMPFGAIILTLCSTLIPIGLGVFVRYRYNRVADIILKISLWSLLVTLFTLFILTGTMLGPELLATIPASVYVVAVLMPLAGYAAGYGLGTLFKLPPNSKRTVSLETGCQNVQLCTAILKLAFPPQIIGGIYMFPLLYALFQAAEAGLFILGYKMYRKDILHKQEALDEDDDTDVTYKKLKEEEVGVDTAYGSVTVNDPNSIMMESRQSPLEI